MIARVETKPKMQTYRRGEMETMHLFDTHADEEKALCGDEYLERRKDGLPVGNVCEPCKVHAVRLAENRILKLEADAEELRVGADELERMAAGSPADGAERVLARYRNSASGRRSEADGFEDEARELRRLVERLKRETGLNVPGR